MFVSGVQALSSKRQAAVTSGEFFQAVMPGEAVTNCLVFCLWLTAGQQGCKCLATSVVTSTDGLLSSLCVLTAG